MHPRVYEEFERICAKRDVTGRVLEVGAVPTAESLLFMRSLDRASEKIGINLAGPYELDGFRIVRGNANEMTCFSDASFDLVLCNAMLEHDKHFWKTISEIHRVSKAGGHIVIGAPGFVRYAGEGIKGRLRRLPLFRRLYKHRLFNALFVATITYEVHPAPGDYYRFSKQAFRDVFFAGCRDVEITSIMCPPRVIGSGIKA